MGTRVWVATIEDVIVAKLEWSKLAGGSARQLEDVRALVEMNEDRLDREYIEASVAELDLQTAWESVAGRK